MAVGGAGAGNFNPRPCVPPSITQYWTQYYLLRIICSIALLSIPPICGIVVTGRQSRVGGVRR